jgi:hypothetical protein
LRRAVVIFTLAAVVVMMLVAATPAIAQDAKAAKAQAKAEAKAAKAQAKQQKQMPSSGGFSTDQAALLGLGAGALIVGGGILVGLRKTAR